MNASIDLTMLFHSGTARMRGTHAGGLHHTRVFAVAPGRSLLARGLVIPFLRPEAVILLKAYEEEAVATSLFHILNPSTLENVRANCSASMPIKTQRGRHWAYRDRSEQFKRLISMETC